MHTYFNPYPQQNAASFQQHISDIEYAYAALQQAMRDFETAYAKGIEPMIRHHANQRATATATASRFQRSIMADAKALVEATKISWQVTMADVEDKRREHHSKQVQKREREIQAMIERQNRGNF
jgi:hypothetical protein